MKVSIFTYLTLFLLLLACAEPKGKVYLDKSLQEEENVKFCFTGDMGKDTAHQEVLAEALRRENCNRIFFLGDLVYPKGINGIDDPHLEDTFLRYYDPLLNNDLNLHINLVLGNHDHKGDPAAWKKIGEKNDRYFFPNYWYMIDYGGLCFVALDTSFYYYLSEVGETAEQTRFIQGLQSRLKECDLKVAVTHHPFKGVGYDAEDDWEGSSGALKVFLDTYVIGVFDIHLAGHVHIVVDDGKDEGTRMLISGAGGETRAGNPAGFIVLNWQPKNPKRIGYQIRYIDTETIIVDEGIAGARQEEEAYDILGEFVGRGYVEESFIRRTLNWLGSLF